MKIYTKTGDDGTTALFGGVRLPKHDLRFETAGTIDELNAQIGVTRSFWLPVSVKVALTRIQGELFQVGAEVSAVDKTRLGIPLIGSTHIETLETEIDEWEALLPPLKNFILPAGGSDSPAAPHLHLARAVCRRAERRVYELFDRDCEEEPEAYVPPTVGIYLNRLSDHLFVAARLTGKIATERLGCIHTEQEWNMRK